MSDDKIVPTYDKDGNLAGVFNISDVLRMQEFTARAAVMSIGKEREDIISDVLATLRGHKEHARTMSAVSALAEVIEILDSTLTVADEATGMGVRAKLMEVYGSDAA